MLKQHIEKLMRRENLDAIICQQVMTEIFMTDTINMAQIAAFLVLLRAKKETPEELHGMLQFLKEKMLQVSLPLSALDIVGTGGDGAGTLNISTGSAILAASCGVKIIKHGNRAVSSQAGSADVLEALGVKIALTPVQVAKSVADIGIGFCYAPHFNPLLMQLRLLRQQLAIPTIFNILGPLLNPAQPDYMILGVFDAALMPLIAETLRMAKIKRAVVVNGCNLDEISTLGQSCVIEVTPEKCNKFLLDPRIYGFHYCQKKDLQGGTAAYNARQIQNAFAGIPSPFADTLILNAAVATWLYGLFTSIEEAVPYVTDKLRSGAAQLFLKNWIEYSYD